MNEQEIRAAMNVDWGQVRANKGSPCFHVEDDRFCLRDRDWDGHYDGRIHLFEPLYVVMTRVSKRSERVSGGTPGARGEETAAPTSPGLWRCENCGDAYDVADSRWRMADVPEHACGSIPQCGHFRSRWFGSGPPELPTYEGPRSRPYIRVEPTSPAAWTEEQRVAAVSTYSVLLDANARELHNDYWCEAIAKVAPLFAPPKPAPSVEDSTFTPDREALPRRLACHGFDPDGGPRFATDSAGPWCLWKEVAPLIAERDALRKERDEAVDANSRHDVTRERAQNLASFLMDIGEHDLPGKTHAEAIDRATKKIHAMIGERDALRARIADLESLNVAWEKSAIGVQNDLAKALKRIAELEARNPTVTRDALAEAVTCHGQASLTDSVALVLKRAGIEVTP